MNGSRLLLGICVLCVIRGSSVVANPPTASYIYPAGGQRGTTVKVRVGGLFLYDRCGFDLTGRGLTASPELTRTERLWFEGPVLPLPESQQQEDYPADMLGTVTIAKDAAGEPCRGRVFTAQGAAGGLVFVVGDLPEVVEQEVDGDAIPSRVTLPITANGRIFPRDDADLWDFDAAAGQTITVLARASSLNSPLTPRLDVLDATGRVLAETMTYPVRGSDASVRFTAPAAGRYRVRITDVRSQGGPAYVYRLTFTTAVEAPPAPQPGERMGRIAKPGAVDEWPVTLAKGGKYTIELDARRAGSPLCGVITIHDAAGKELARAVATDTSADPILTFTPPTSGTYTVRVAERFRSRGGPEFIYRLRITEPTAGVPSFRLTLPTDTFTVLRGVTAKLRVTVERQGGFTGPIALAIDGLPNGVTVSPSVFPTNASSLDLTLTATASATVAAHRLRIRGIGIAGLHTIRPAEHAAVPGNRFLPAEPTLLLAVGIPTPFKIIDRYVMTSAPRGEIYRRMYRIDRNGFDGPITVQLAEKQARHLQGVTGPVLTIPPGQTEFEYPAYLPPWMELGRTCRVCVMAVGKVKDASGREHAVSFSSVDQNQQMIVVVGPGRLGLELGTHSVRVAGEVHVPVMLRRGKDLAGPVTVAAVIPAHWRGVTADAVTIPGTASTAEIVLKFTPDAGPFNMPLTIRATATTPNTPVVAEAKLDVVR